MASRDKKHQRTDGEIRRSQLLTSYGAGAMVDLVDAAVLVSGLDAWSFHPTKGYESIEDEPRLRDAIARRFQAAGLQLAKDGAFRKPPAGDHDDPTPMCGIPALIFPRWFVCQRCRALVRNDGLEPKGTGYVHTLCTTKKRGAECVPVRFVAACRRGHLQEFPWKLFVHHKRPRDAPPCPGTSLRLFEGASGDFSEIVVRCETCGERQSMANALVKQGGPLPRCDGHRPWLGPDAREPDCTEQLRLLVRTGSNGYFSMTESALSIPEPGRELEVKVASVWDVLVNADRDTLKVFRASVPKVGQALEGYADADVLAAIEVRRSGGPAAQEGLRTAEYRQLVASKDEQPGVVPPEEERFYARRIAPSLPTLSPRGDQGGEPLGGLVEQGRRMRQHLRRAWDLGRLCSGDPVCAAHSPEDDPAERFLEGAACHGCLYVAECSCERLNRYLDRALVVPTIGNASSVPLRGNPNELAFLAERP